MDLFEAIRSRRTVQSFAASEVPDSVLNRALEAANYAPNHKLTYPWRFTIPGPEARVKLAALNERLKGLRKPLLDPGAIVAFSCIRNPDPLRAREDYAAVSCAIQNFMLALWADGWRSKWATGPVTKDAETYKILRLDPEKEESVGFVFVGQAALEPIELKRPPYTEFVRRID